LRPLKPDTEYESSTSIVDVADKGSGLVLTTRLECYEIGEK
jgi:hypothetical protein